MNHARRTRPAHFCRMGSAAYGHTSTAPFYERQTPHIQLDTDAQPSVRSRRRRRFGDQLFSYGGAQADGTGPVHGPCSLQAEGSAPAHAIGGSDDAGETARGRQKHARKWGLQVSVMLDSMVQHSRRRRCAAARAESKGERLVLAGTGPVGPAARGCWLERVSNRLRQAVRSEAVTEHSQLPPVRP